MMFKDRESVFNALPTFDEFSPEVMLKAAKILSDLRFDVDPHVGSCFLIKDDYQVCFIDLVIDGEYKIWVTCSCQHGVYRKVGVSAKCSHAAAGISLMIAGLVIVK